MPAVHLLVKGRVQGVFYRASAKEVAERLALTGWVRNTVEGHVEIMACGQKEPLQTFIDWCRQGPRSAVVQEVVVEPVAEETHTGFIIKRTGD